MMRTRTRILIAGYLTLLALVASPRLASASYWGGSWPYSYTNNAYQLLYLPYGNYTGGDPHVSALVGPAAQEWVNAPAPPDVYSSGSYLFYLDLNNGIPGGNAGYTWINNGNLGNMNCANPCNGKGTYYTAHITFATAVMNSYSNALAQGIIAHEMGHVIGLGHADYNNPSNCRSLMYHVVTTNDPGLAPSGYDVWQENVLYPNTRYGAHYAC